MLKDLEKYIGLPFKRKSKYGWSLQTMICKEIRLGSIKVGLQEVEGQYIGIGVNPTIIVKTEEGTEYNYNECYFNFRPLTDNEFNFHTEMKTTTNRKKTILKYLTVNKLNLKTIEDESRVNK